MRSEFLTAVMMKIPIFGYVMPCKLVNRLQRVENKGWCCSYKSHSTRVYKEERKFSCTTLHNGGSILLQTFGTCLPNYMASCPRRLEILMKPFFFFSPQFLYSVICVYIYIYIYIVENLLLDKYQEN